jgi:hypothetical protein
LNKRISVQQTQKSFSAMVFATPRAAGFTEERLPIIL